MSAKNTIIIGAGVSGIAMAHTLRCRLGYTDFEVGSDYTTHDCRDLQSVQVFEKRESIGGTWKANTYPGW